MNVPFEIVISDDSSTDRTPEILHAFKKCKHHILEAVIVMRRSFFYSMIFLVLFLKVTPLPAKPFVRGTLQGRLGNQFFIVAANVSLALDNGAEAVFPDFIQRFDSDIPTNYKNVFWRLNVSKPSKKVSFFYQEPYIPFTNIPFHPNMQTCGWFASEKYFIHHKKEILALFAPSRTITEYLNKKYQDIINQPNTVAVHARAYFLEDANAANLFMSYGADYFEKAMSLFPDDTLFVVFSDKMDWCKEEFSKIDKNIIFIEGETHFHDLYLMSMCKHQILSNSTFSWWGAYLNPNPTKLVIAPPQWFSPGSGMEDSLDLFPEEWIILN